MSYGANRGVIPRGSVRYGEWDTRSEALIAARKFLKKLPKRIRWMRYIKFHKAYDWSTRKTLWSAGVYAYDEPRSSGRKKLGLEAD